MACNGKQAKAWDGGHNQTVRKMAVAMETALKSSREYGPPGAERRPSLEGINDTTRWNCIERLAKRSLAMSLNIPAEKMTRESGGWNLVVTLPYKDMGINVSTEQRLAGREDSEGMSAPRPRREVQGHRQCSVAETPQLPLDTVTTRRGDTARLEWSRTVALVPGRGRDPLAPARTRYEGCQLGGALRLKDKEVDHR
ncbi:hypothetical protein EYF80_016147 [Liparis tanakae]|uniref:Uncharacterized protein n=1 Tax=Liparis tanakae TaxID=230148 RepID=A0A4Z2I880_9TELE|nr:hypothetical protein EYF80_016147 [Liparis tanakae]